MWKGQRIKDSMQKNVFLYTSHELEDPRGKKSDSKEEGKMHDVIKDELNTRY